MPESGKYWLQIAAVSATLAAIFMGGGFLLSTATPHSRLWISPPFAIGYVPLVVALACIVFAACNYPFPLVRRSPRRGTALISSSPEHLRSDKGYGGGVVHEVDLRRLTSKYAALTTAERSGPLKRYTGKWILLPGEVSDVGEWTGRHAQVTLRSYSTKEDVSATFSDKNSFDADVSILERGAHVTVLGQIAEIRSNQLIIANCEFGQASSSHRQPCHPAAHH